MATQAANPPGTCSVPTKANILLTRLKSIGDILFTLPAVHRLRTVCAEAKISFLVSKEFVPLLEGFRDVDTVIALDRARFRQRNPGILLAEVVSVLRQVRRPRFSLAIDFQGYGETALLTRWTGAPQRWGMVTRPGRSWAYTRGVNRALQQHPADNFLSLLNECGLPKCPVHNQFVLPARALDEAQQFFKGHALNPTLPTLFIQPFTSSPHKDWPLEAYLAVARSWREHGRQVLFGGGPADRTALELARKAGFPVAAGAPLLVTAGLMGQSMLVLGGDTGLLHLAVAMGKRVVMLIGSVDPGSAHPFQHPDWTVTPAAGQALATLTVDDVKGTCARAFSELT
jgi:ADP-heptose:LPS heptosyltransferase